METGFQYLTSLGYKLISVANPNTFIEDTPTATLIRQVLGVISQFEKSQIVEKLKGARKRKKVVNKKGKKKKILQIILKLFMVKIIIGIKNYTLMEKYFQTKIIFIIFMLNFNQIMEGNIGFMEW